MRPFLFYGWRSRSAELLLHRRIARLIWITQSAIRRRVCILHPVRRPESRVAARVGSINLIVQIRFFQYSESYLLLIRSRNEQSAIHRGIVDKLPLVVFFLF